MRHLQGTLLAMEAKAMLDGAVGRVKAEQALHTSTLPLRMKSHIS